MARNPALPELASHRHPTIQGAARIKMVSFPLILQARQAKIDLVMSWVLKLTTSGGEIYSRSSHWKDESSSQRETLTDAVHYPFNAVRTAQQRAGNLLAVEYQRSTSVESRSVVAKTDTGKHMQSRWSRCRFS